MSLFKVIGSASRVVPRGWAMRVYEQRFLANLIRRTLNHFVPDGQTAVKIVSGPLLGTRLTLELKKEKSLWLGTYEPWVQREVLSYLRPGDVAWEAGAFIGYHTILMSKIVGPDGRVLALEPDPMNRERLECNLKLSGIHDVDVLPMAAGAVGGRAYLKRADGGWCSKIVASPDVLDNALDVSVVSLDDLLSRFPRPTLIKVDVEGSEGAVLKGASRLLKEVKPTWIVEVHDPLSGQQVSKILQDHGLHVRTIGKGESMEMPTSWPGHLLGFNPSGRQTT